MPRKKYSASVDYEAKLQTVMERLGIEKFNYDWTRRDCFVEMIYHGQVYRFENSFEKASACGRRIQYVSDLFAEVVLSLEAIARATEKDIFTLDMLFVGVPSIPAKITVPACFVSLGFSEVPRDEGEVRSRYHERAKQQHPDSDSGSRQAFEELNRAYQDCLAYFKH